MKRSYCVSESHTPTQERDRTLGKDRRDSVKRSYSEERASALLRSPLASPLGRSADRIHSNGKRDRAKIAAG
ncbi:MULTISPECIES: hypothetical protein [unclassified Coleofasciculus]|uniref:hypothetical protein n=1 Tax=unclassified Coleofasciculus TaxID=2692782 RepID=UPI00188293A6|nr:MULTISPECIES: hypothetical protein [unclassified Coleofasciculus]MBE9127431.1 hypothetical protein [Coleofasciculus sp. LEGE 07081]MBE9149243.1 hypothetical protein [Coleofasciculus sp. LEGE 07092]